MSSATFCLECEQEEIGDLSEHINLPYCEKCLMKSKKCSNCGENSCYMSTIDETGGNSFKCYDCYVKFLSKNVTNTVFKRPREEKEKEPSKNPVSAFPPTPKYGTAKTSCPKLDYHSISFLEKERLEILDRKGNALLCAKGKFIGDVDLNNMDIIQECHHVKISGENGIEGGEGRAGRPGQSHDLAQKKALPVQKALPPRPPLPKPPPKANLPNLPPPPKRRALPSLPPRKTASKLPPPPKIKKMEDFEVESTETDDVVMVVKTEVLPEPEKKVEEEEEEEEEEKKKEYLDGEDGDDGRTGGYGENANDGEDGEKGSDGYSLDLFLMKKDEESYMLLGQICETGECFFKELPMTSFVHIDSSGGLGGRGGRGGEGGVGGKGGPGNQGKEGKDSDARGGHGGVGGNGGGGGNGGRGGEGGNGGKGGKGGSIRVFSPHVGLLERIRYNVTGGKGGKGGRGGRGGEAGMGGPGGYAGHGGLCLSTEIYFASRKNGKKGKPGKEGGAGEYGKRGEKGEIGLNGNNGNVSFHIINPDNLSQVVESSFEGQKYKLRIESFTVRPYIGAYRKVIEPGDRVTISNFVIRNDGILGSPSMDFEIGIFSKDNVLEFGKYESNLIELRQSIPPGQSVVVKDTPIVCKVKKFSNPSEFDFSNRVEIFGILKVMGSYVSNSRKEKAFNVAYGMKCKFADDFTVSNGEKKEIKFELKNTMGVEHRKMRVKIMGRSFKFSYTPEASLVDDSEDVDADFGGGEEYFQSGMERELEVSELIVRKEGEVKDLKFEISLLNPEPHYIVQPLTINIYYQPKEGGKKDDENNIIEDPLLYTKKYDVRVVPIFDFSFENLFSSKKVEVFTQEEDEGGSGKGEDDVLDEGISGNTVFIFTSKRVSRMRFESVERNCTKLGLSMYLFDYQKYVDEGNFEDWNIFGCVKNSTFIFFDRTDLGILSSPQLMRKICRENRNNIVYVHDDRHVLRRNNVPMIPPFLNESKYYEMVGEPIPVKKSGLRLLSQYSSTLQSKAIKELEKVQKKEPTSYFRIVQKIYPEDIIKERGEIGHFSIQRHCLSASDQIYTIPSFYNASEYVGVQSFMKNSFFSFSMSSYDFLIFYTLISSFSFEKKLRLFVNHEKYPFYFVSSSTVPQEMIKQGSKKKEQSKDLLDPERNLYIYSFKDFLSSLLIQDLQETKYFYNTGLTFAEVRFECLFRYIRRYKQLHHPIELIDIIKKSIQPFQAASRFSLTRRSSSSGVTTKHLKKAEQCMDMLNRHKLNVMMSSGIEIDALNCNSSRWTSKSEKNVPVGDDEFQYTVFPFNMFLSQEDLQKCFIFTSPEEAALQPSSMATEPEVRMNPSPLFYKYVDFPRKLENSNIGIDLTFCFGSDETNKVNPELLPQICHVRSSLITQMGRSKTSKLTEKVHKKPFRSASLIAAASDGTITKTPMDEDYQPAFDDDREEEEEERVVVLCDGFKMKELKIGGSVGVSLFYNYYEPFFSTKKFTKDFKVYVLRDLNNQVAVLFKFEGKIFRFTPTPGEEKEVIVQLPAEEPFTKIEKPKLPAIPTHLLKKKEEEEKKKGEETEGEFGDDEDDNDLLVTDLPSIEAFETDSFSTTREDSLVGQSLPVLPSMTTSLPAISGEPPKEDEEEEIVEEVEEEKVEIEEEDEEEEEEEEFRPVKLAEEKGSEIKKGKLSYFNIHNPLQLSSMCVSQYDHEKELSSLPEQKIVKELPFIDFQTKYPVVLHHRQIYNSKHMFVLDSLGTLYIPLSTDHEKAIIKFGTHFLRRICVGDLLDWFVCLEFDSMKSGRGGGGGEEEQRLDRTKPSLEKGKVILESFCQDVMGEYWKTETSHKYAKPGFFLKTFRYKNRYRIHVYRREIRDGIIRKVYGNIGQLLLHHRYFVTAQASQFNKYLKEPEEAVKLYQKHAPRGGFRGVVAGLVITPSFATQAIGAALLIKSRLSDNATISSNISKFRGDSNKNVYLWSLEKKRYLSFKKGEFNTTKFGRKNECWFYRMGMIVHKATKKVITLVKTPGKLNDEEADLSVSLLDEVKETAEEEHKMNQMWMLWKVGGKQTKKKEVVVIRSFVNPKICIFLSNNMKLWVKEFDEDDNMLRWQKC